MRNNYWYDQNQYGQNSYVNTPCWYTCPAIQNNYGYYPPIYDNLYRTEDEDDLINDNYDEFNTIDRGYNITQEHVEKVYAMMRQDSMNIFKDIQKFIRDTKLLDYILVALITYICINYQKYEHVIDEKTDELVEDLRQNLPWVFDILKIFGITPAVLDNFLDTLIRTSVMNLRKLLPSIT
jgi:hypothetical protein